MIRTRAVRGAIIAVILLGAVVGLVLVVMAAQTGVDSSTPLPDYVEALIPGEGDEVLRQETVGIDLATGYEGYLEINGVNVRDAQIETPELGLIEYQPGPGQEIESLNADSNCVVARVWPLESSEDDADTISWCFTAA
ncbi:MAG: hypothetical protein JJLCMIEE_02385 [Acidimicrobiales bacterium]|nr:MAG: hypothetical protein EDR02_15955 [Actinomycetota bacterium]MBV6509316.1 hypothetical protein [Acidimicrobiales bacterium]RIK03959.1 MAG: hypothetical protein DCC48_14735 [Acidobacteriota bacterium]